MGIATLLATFAGTASAQEPVTPPAPLPIPTAGIPAAAEALTALLRDIEALVAAPATIERARAELPALVDSVAADLRELDDEIARHGSPRSLLDLHLQWARHRADIAALQERIASRWEQLQSRFDRLREQDLRWRATAESLRSDAAAPALVDRTQRAIRDIDAARGSLNASIAEILVLQERAADAQARVLTALQQVDRRAAVVRGQLWQPDTPPLWAAWPREFGLLTQLRTEYTDAAEQIRRFGLRSQGILVLQFALFVAIAAVFVVLKRRMAVLDDADRVLQATLSRPLSLALLLALIIGTTLQEQPPMPVVDLMFLLSIVPLLRVAAPVAPPSLRASLFEVCGLFAAFLLLTPVDAAGPTARILVIGIDVLAVALFLRALRQHPPRRVTRYWLRYAAVAMALCAAAIFLGWTALGTLGSDATLRSGFFGLISLIASTALAGLVRLVPRGALSGWVRHLRRHADLVVRRGTRLVNLTLALMWSWVTLKSYDVLDPLTATVTRLLAVDLSVGAISLTVGGLLNVLWILFVTALLSRYVRFLLDEEVLTRLGMSIGEKSAVNTVVHYVFLLVGGLIAAGAAGLNTTQLTVVAGALSVGIGFGLQAIVSNFVSGLILVFERPISVGDRVEVGGRLGIVQRIGIRASVIRTYDGAEIILPNSELISQQVVNWTFSDEKRRVDIPVGVAYGSDTGMVLEVLRRVADSDPLVLDLPRAEVLFTGFGDSSLNFVLRCWVRVADSVDAVSSLGLGIDRELRRARIEIPFPQRDLHLRSGFAAPPATTAADD